MKRYHQYINSHGWTNKQKENLGKYNIFLKPKDYFINIYEDADPNLKSYLDGLDITHYIGVEFSNEELINAEYSIIDRVNLIGYPMPDHNWGYLELTYDLSNYCETCGVEAVQKDSFRIKKIPSLKNKMFRLNWVFGEIFVERNFYEEIFKPFGFEYRDVRVCSKGYPITDLYVQLIIPTIDQPLDLSDFEFDICPTCGYKKHHPSSLNFFPLQENPLPYLYKSKEYFGGGGTAADKKIFIQKELRDLIIKTGFLQQDSFIPCK